MPTEPSLTLVRRLKAPPARVYDAWTDPALMMRWWGPGQVETVQAEADARIGGRFHVVMRAPDGEEHDVSGVYREVEPPRKLVFTWTWRSTPERESLVSVDLASEGEGTLLTLTHERLFDETVRDHHEAGWSATLDQLEALFA